VLKSRERYTQPRARVGLADTTAANLRGHEHEGGVAPIFAIEKSRRRLIDGIVILLLDQMPPPEQRRAAQRQDHGGPDAREKGVRDVPYSLLRAPRTAEFRHEHRFSQRIVELRAAAQQVHDE
jgi:hypothetical protein